MLLYNLLNIAVVNWSPLTWEGIICRDVVILFTIREHVVKKIALCRDVVTKDNVM